MPESSATVGTTAIRAGLAILRHALHQLRDLRFESTATTFVKHERELERLLEEVGGLTCSSTDRDDHGGDTCDIHEACSFATCDHERRARDLMAQADPLADRRPD